MIDALDNESEGIGEGADIGPPSQAALASPPHLPRLIRIRRNVLMLWDAAPGFALTLSTMISLVLLAALAFLLMQELAKRAVTIQPISVHRELSGEADASRMAARCCRTLRTHS